MAAGAAAAARLRPVVVRLGVAATARCQPTRCQSGAQGWPAGAGRASRRLAAPTGAAELARARRPDHLPPLRPPLQPAGGRAAHPKVQLHRRKAKDAHARRRRRHTQRGARSRRAAGIGALLAGAGPSRPPGSAQPLPPRADGPRHRPHACVDRFVAGSLDQLIAKRAGLMPAKPSVGVR
eukprot:scaffold23604_cov112-Isochrysis_galbana.AAC.1